MFLKKKHNYSVRRNKKNKKVEKKARIISVKQIQQPSFLLHLYFILSTNSSIDIDQFLLRKQTNKTTNHIVHFIKSTNIHIVNNITFINSQFHYGNLMT